MSTNKVKLTTISFLRNETLFSSRKEAIDGLKRAADSHPQDGMPILARYLDNGKINTLFGILYCKNDAKFISIFGSNETISWDKENALFYEDIYKSYNNSNENGNE